MPKYLAAHYIQQCMHLLWQAVFVPGELQRAAPVMARHGGLSALRRGCSHACAGMLLQAQLMGVARQCAAVARRRNVIDLHPILSIKATNISHRMSSVHRSYVVDC